MVGAGIILFGLLPFINVFVLMAGGVADRYVFSASLGSLIPIVYGIKLLLERKQVFFLFVVWYTVLIGVYFASSYEGLENKEGCIHRVCNNF